MRECMGCCKVDDDINEVGVGVHLCGECHKKWQKVREDAQEERQDIIVRYCHFCGTALTLDWNHPGCGGVVCGCGERFQLPPNRNSQRRRRTPTQNHNRRGVFLAYTDEFRGDETEDTQYKPHRRLTVIAALFITFLFALIVMSVMDDRAYGSSTTTR
jgi:hypothetical protein